MTDTSRNQHVDWVIQFFEYSHLPPHLQSISRQCHELAINIVDKVPSNPELTVGLRKLLEAKDCFVRAQLARSPD